MNDQQKIWAIIPAAGIGSRMQTEIPKQYIDLLGKKVIEHVLCRMVELPALEGVIVAVKENDTYWPAVNKPECISIDEVAGGDERCHSVLNALRALSDKYTDKQIPSVWVLVHDAARPCVRSADMQALIKAVGQNENGGLLASPVRDTIKLANAECVDKTIPRDQLWHAYTPQYFRLDILLKALESVIEQGVKVTDESQAMELMGYHPRLVRSSEDNIKITSQQDLELAELFIKESLIK